MRTRGFVLLVFLVSLSGLSLAGCSRSESSSPAASASASAAQASALVTCSKVAMAIAEGNLTTAETDLANLSDIQCQPDLAAVITAQRAEAATLATSALAPGITDRASVARAALALDSQNAIALALVSQLPDAEPSDIPGVMATPSPVAAVADEPTPRETITTAATTSSAPLIAGSIALLTGALLGRFLPFPWLLKLRRGRRVLGISALVSGAYVFLAVYAWPVLSAPDWGDVGGPAASLARWIFGREHTREPFIWLLAAIAGVLVMFYLRSAAASVVKVMGAGGDNGSLDSAFADLVLSEMQIVGGSRPAGTFEVAGGTDLQADIGTALDQVSNAVVKVVVALWRIATTGLGDQISVQLVGTGAQRRALVRFQRGTRLLDHGSVSAAQFLLDQDKPTEEETRHQDRDLATGIASRLVLASLRVRPGMVWPKLRRGLYGAERPSAVALCAVAERRVDPATQCALFGSALRQDPLNKVAKFGLAVTLARSLSTETGAVEDCLSKLKEVGTPLAKEPLGLRARYASAAIRVNIFHSEPTERQRAMDQLVALQDDLRHWRGDRAFRWHLMDLVRTALLALEAVQGPAPNAACESLVTEAGLLRPDCALNIAGGLAMYAAYTQAAGPEVRKAAFTAMRTAGLNTSGRKGVAKDPLIQLLKVGSEANAREFREVLREWGLLNVPYTGLETLGADTAAMLAPWYPKPAALKSALAGPRRPGGKRNPARRLLSSPSKDWWIGGLDWLSVGNEMAVINLYQRAGFINAASLAGVIDTVVVARLAMAIDLSPTPTPRPPPAPPQALRQLPPAPPPPD